VAIVVSVSILLLDNRLTLFSDPAHLTELVAWLNERGLPLWESPRDTTFWLGRINWDLRSAPALPLIVFGISAWIPRALRPAWRSSSWLACVGWLVAAMPMLDRTAEALIDALFLPARGTFVSDVSIRWSVAAYVLIGVLYLLRSTWLGDRIQRNDRATRWWAGLLALGFAALSVVRFWSEPGQTVETQITTFLGASVFLAPAIIYSLRAASKGSLAVMFQVCPNYLPGAQRIGTWAISHQDLLHAWATAALVYWMSASFSSLTHATSMWFLLWPPGPLLYTVDRGSLRAPQ